MHGRVYISQNFVCFYANLFGVKTQVFHINLFFSHSQEVISMKDIVDIQKTKTIGMGITIKIANDQRVIFL